MVARWVCYECLSCDRRFEKSYLLLLENLTSMKWGWSSNCEIALLAFSADLLNYVHMHPQLEY